MRGAENEPTYGSEAPTKSEPGPRASSRTEVPGGTNAPTDREPPTPGESPAGTELPGEGSNPGERNDDPTRSPEEQAKLNRFTESCRKEAEFHEGQLDYPLTLRMRMGAATTYAAAVDIRKKPLPPGKVIDTNNPGSDPIYVQCVVGARLVPVGDDIDVEVADGSDGGWKYQEFTPKGEIKWSWSVTARTPAVQELRLELRPAARELSSIREGGYTIASYVTKVTVDASAIARFSYWLQTEGKLLETIGVILGAAFLGILAFSTRARDGLHKLFRPNPDWKSESQPADKVSDEKADVTKQAGTGSTVAGKDGHKRPAHKKSKRT